MGDIEEKDKKSEPEEGSEIDGSPVEDLTPEKKFTDDVKNVDYLGDSFGVSPQKDTFNDVYDNITKEKTKSKM